MARLQIPRSLAALFPGVPRQLELSAGDVEGLIRVLDERYPGMWDRLCEPGPRLRPHMKVFVDRGPATLDTPLVEASLVHIIPAVSGGDDGAEGRGACSSGVSPWARHR
jgi:sulfur-carrier protein